MPSSIIQLSDINFQRNGQRILSDINWQIEQGQHWALLGANGSGKTTLLKIITGYEWPTSGFVKVMGSVFGKCGIADVRRDIGYVSSAMKVNLSINDKAIDIVVSGLDAALGIYRDYSKAEYQSASHSLDLVSGQGYAQKQFALLSHGQKQRVLIARALINDPKLLVLDEPCTGLDPAGREKFLDDLGRLTNHKNAPSIIFVTHHIEEIRPWISDVMLIKNGRVQAKEIGRAHV